MNEANMNWLIEIRIWDCILGVKPVWLFCENDKIRLFSTISFSTILKNMFVWFENVSFCVGLRFCFAIWSSC